MQEQQHCYLVYTNTQINNNRLPERIFTDLSQTVNWCYENGVKNRVVETVDFWKVGKENRNGTGIVFHIYRHNIDQDD